MFKLINFVFLEIYTHSEFDACNTFQKKLGQKHVYHCVASPFLLTLCKHLGTEDTSC